MLRNTSTKNITEQVNTLYRQRKLEEAQRLIEVNITSFEANQLAGLVLKEVQFNTPDIEFIQKLLGIEKVLESKRDIRGQILFELLNRDVLFNRQLHANFSDNDTILGLCKYIADNRKLNNKKEVIEKIGERVVNKQNLLASFLSFRGVDLQSLERLSEDERDIISIFEHLFEIHNKREVVVKSSDSDIERFISTAFQFFMSKWKKSTTIELAKEIRDLAKEKCDERTFRVLEAYINKEIIAKTSGILYSQNYVLAEQNGSVIATPFLPTAVQQEVIMPVDEAIGEEVEEPQVASESIEEDLTRIIEVHSVKVASVQNVSAFPTGEDLSGIRVSDNVPVQQLSSFIAPVSVEELVTVTQGEETKELLSATTPAFVEQQRIKAINEVQYYGCSYPFYKKLLSLINNPDEFKQACSRTNFFASEAIKGFFYHAIKLQLDEISINLLLSRFHQSAVDSRKVDRAFMKATEVIFCDEFQDSQFDETKKVIIAGLMNNAGLTKGGKLNIIEFLIKDEKYLDFCLEALGKRIKDPILFKTIFGVIIKNNLGRGLDKVILDKIISKGYESLYPTIGEIIKDCSEQTFSAVLLIIKGFPEKLVMECIKSGMEVNEDVLENIVNSKKEVLYPSIARILCRNFCSEKKYDQLKNLPPKLFAYCLHNISSNQLSTLILKYLEKNKDIFAANMGDIISILVSLNSHNALKELLNYEKLSYLGQVIYTIGTIVGIYGAQKRDKVEINFSTQRNLLMQAIATGDCVTLDIISQFVISKHRELSFSLVLGEAYNHFTTLSIFNTLYNSVYNVLNYILQIKYPKEAEIGDRLYNLCYNLGQNQVVVRDLFISSDQNVETISKMKDFNDITILGITTYVIKSASQKSDKHTIEIFTKVFADLTEAKDSKVITDNLKKIGYSNLNKILKSEYEVDPKFRSVANDFIGSEYKKMFWVERVLSSKPKEVQLA